jgi:hypothetical protein
MMWKKARAVEGASGPFTDAVISEVARAPAFWRYALIVR